MTEPKELIQICDKGVWDSTMPGINFDESGVSNYAHMFNRFCQIYPRGPKGRICWENIVEKIKKEGHGKRYDCIIGLSGGTDSSYLVHLAKKEFDLRPLAVNFDNGWSSDVAVNNIKLITKELNVDLETYVADYDEVKAVLRSYIKASLPWVDSPSDIAIKASLYKIAAREGIKYTLNGGDFRSEGKQPTEWTYSDGKQLIYLLRRMEGISKLRSYPYSTIYDLIYYAYLKGIKTYRPYYYIDYQKKQAQHVLASQYGWQYYGGHHHENVFTKFIISYWLPEKFGIDKRKITFSAQIMSGEMSRQEAIEQLKHPAYNLGTLEREKNYVLKKLDMSRAEFDKCFNSPNKYFYDYPSYFSFYSKNSTLAQKLFSKLLPFQPTIFIEQDFRKS